MNIQEQKEKKIENISIIENKEKKRELPKIAFGNDQWIKAFGEGIIPKKDIGKDLEALPKNIEEILESTCPTNSNKKVKDTHVLVWMPKTLIIDGKEQNLTLKTFGQLLKKKHFPDSKQVVTNIFIQM